MSSHNILNRLLPTGGGGSGSGRGTRQRERPSRSFYEELRGGGDHDDDDDDDGARDIEIEAGLDLDEENLKHAYTDADLERALGGVVDDSQPDVSGGRGRGRKPPSGNRDPTQERGRGGGGGGGIGVGRGSGAVAGAGGGAAASRWLARDYDDGDNNDVPASLLVEHHDIDPLPTRGPVAGGGGRGTARSGGHQGRQQQAAVPGPSTARNRALWDNTMAQQRLHPEDSFGMAGPKASAGARDGSGGARPTALLSFVARGDRRQRALWRWTNVTNLDIFVKDVYDYYLGAGIWCILLERVLHLINVGFVAVVLTFLTQCVDYPKIPGSKKTSDIVIPQCTSKISGIWSVGLWIFSFYFIWKLIQYALDIRRLLHMRDFYEYLLEIRDQDMQTVSWQDVVRQILRFRDENPKTAANVSRAHRQFLGHQSKERLDAHDIANRLMRRENYLIALFNKDILNLNLPVPFLGNIQVFSRTMEWCLMFSVLDFVFDASGQVNPEFLKANKRGILSQKLKTRFTFAAIMNLIMAPFVACYLVVVYFFTYYNEYTKNPSAISSRAYTPLAEWKFREFNELPHLFRERLNMSAPFATRYLEQFPKAKTEMVAKTVAFIAGALVAVLAVASLLDPELLTNFQITHDRTALFYLGIFTAIWAFARGSISEENTVFDPEYALMNVIEYTHYKPDHWKGRMHSDDVKREFGRLYKMKLLIFVEEIISLVLTPIVLLVSLPSCSDQIIDFFREFTIHVDGIGYVCSFAVFDFKKGVEDGRQGGPTAAGDIRDDYYSTKHAKLAASYYGFLDNYVINPKTGIPGHLPPGARYAQYQQGFHQPPPHFPGLGSPTLGGVPADMHGSSIQGPLGRARSRQPPGTSAAVAARTPRFGAAGGPPIALPSPMGSILLDPHHQPSATALGALSTHRLPPRGVGPQPHRGGAVPFGHNRVIDESLEDGVTATAANAGKRGSGSADDNDDIYESANGLGESVWETSPVKNLSREGSGATADHDEPETGVLGLIYQYGQAHKNHRPGGVL